MNSYLLIESYLEERVNEITAKEEYDGWRKRRDQLYNKLKKLDKNHPKYKSIESKWRVTEGPLEKWSKLLYQYADERKREGRGMLGVKLPKETQKDKLKSKVKQFSQTFKRKAGEFTKSLPMKQLVLKRVYQ